MLIGESMNTDCLCFIVTGDLAFFYDMNALGIRHIKNNVRVLLINNGGGAEFKIMTRTWKDDVHVDDYISANGHNGNAKGWAENCGFEYIAVYEKEEFSSVADRFVSSSSQPILMEVFTDGNNEPIAISNLLDANRISTPSSAIGNILTSIVGEKGKSVIKKLIGR